MKKKNIINILQSSCKDIKCIIKILNSYLYINLISDQCYQLAFEDPEDLSRLLKDTERTGSNVNLSRIKIDNCRSFSENILQDVRETYGDINKVDCVFISDKNIILTECKFLEEKYIQNIDNFILFLYHRVITKFLIFDFLFTRKYYWRDRVETIWIFICAVRAFSIVKKFIEHLRSMYKLFVRKIFYFHDSMYIMLFEIPYILKSIYVVFLILKDGLPESIDIPIDLLVYSDCC